MLIVVLNLVPAGEVLREEQQRRCVHHACSRFGTKILQQYSLEFVALIFLFVSFFTHMIYFQESNRPPFFYCLINIQFSVYMMYLIYTRILVGDSSFKDLQSRVLHCLTVQFIGNLLYGAYGLCNARVNGMGGNHAIQE